MYEKLAGGAMLGTFLPIGVEYVAKGARISDQIPFKISGVAGTTLGFFTGILPLVWKGHPVRKMINEENKAAIIAFGAADFATGVSILVLDELKKRAGYTFNGKLPIGLRNEGVEGLERPVAEIVKEI